MPQVSRTSRPHVAHFRLLAIEPGGHFIKLDHGGITVALDGGNMAVSRCANADKFDGGFGHGEVMKRLATDAIDVSAFLDEPIPGESAVTDPSPQSEQEAVVTVFSRWLRRSHCPLAGGIKSAVRDAGRYTMRPVALASLGNATGADIFRHVPRAVRSLGTVYRVSAGG